MNFRDVLDRTVGMYPRKEALVIGERRYTYAQFNERVNRMANALLGLGLQRGDRVALLAENCLEYIELYWAIPIAGLAIVPLNFRLTPRELEYVLNDSEPGAIIAQDAHVPTINAIRASLPSVKHYVSIGGMAHEGYVSYEQLVERGDPGRPPVDVHEDDMAYLMYTSGTTGKPKGAMLSHRALIASATNHIALRSEFQERHSVGLVTAPMFHVAAAASQRTMIMVGGKIIVLGGFEPKLVLETVQKERVTHFFVAPVMLIALLNEPDFKKYDLSSIRTLGYASAPMPVEVLKMGMRELGQIFQQGYGMTETGPVGTCLVKADHILDGTPEEVRRLASAGRAELNVIVRVVDENGNDVAPEQVGEVIIKSDSVMKGYWRKHEETAEALRNGWYYSGDVATVDEEGYIFIVDRKKDLIISGGENIYPREVEEILYGHPSVLECAVIGVPDDYWGESVKAFVVLKEGQTATQEELIAFCRGNLASYKKPRTVEFMDQLPRNTSGKLLKSVLREKYWAGLDRKV